MDSNKKKEPQLIEGEVIGETIADNNDAPASHDNSKRTQNKYALSSPSMVTKSNSLIQKTRYSLPRVQQKILLAMIAQIDPKNDTDPNKVYSMSFNDFSKLTGVNMASRSYRAYLKSTIKDLADSSFWMEAESSQGEEDRLIRWIGDDTKINYKTKTIQMQFSKNIFPYLTQLKSNYTSFNVEYLLQMNSTYSMRFYEIILSYDNGDTDYGYTNGIVFQTVTNELLEKFPDKAQDIKGFKYKVFDIQKLKEQLSPAPERDKKAKASHSREKPLTEKYANFNDFERNVLKIAKEEINAMTDLWFDYIPVRIKGSRSYQRIYLFIKYKTPEEMKAVKENYAATAQDDEIPRRGHKNPKPASQPTAKPTIVNEGDPIGEDVFNLSVTKAVRLLEAKACYNELKQTFDQDMAATIEGVFVYTARLLTNTSEKKIQIAHETREALNRVIDNNGNLKAWAVGMAKMMNEKQAAGLLKSPQYNATVVFNAIEDIKVLADGKTALENVGKESWFAKHALSMFDDI